ncbi:MAG: hypothetical protein HYV07_04320 [Deltaproteobacteria bacterium]|nr:hypothetical protein [Deltaproteobacteria bacterium]
MSAAVTAYGLRTALGSKVEEVFSRLVSGECAALMSPSFSTETYPVRFGAVLKAPLRPSRHARFVRRLGQHAIEVGREVFEHAGLSSGPRLGLFFATGTLSTDFEELAPKLRRQRSDAENCWSLGLGELHPFWLLRHLSNNAHGLLAADLGAKGEGLVCAGTNAAAQTIASAAEALEVGSIDVALVVAMDSLVVPEVLVSPSTLFREPAGAPKPPYGLGSRGAFPGEAVAALCLERVADAGPRALALIEAHAFADGSPGEPSEETLAHAVAELAGRSVKLVDGAGRARRDFDDAERRSLGRALGETALLSATSAALGVTGAAHSAVQAILLIEMLRRGIVPAIAGLEDPAPGPLTPARSLETVRDGSAIGVSTGAPGLVGVVRVELMATPRKY